MSAYELVNLLEDLIECGELDLDAKVCFYDEAFPDVLSTITNYSVDTPKQLILYERLY